MVALLETNISPFKGSFEDDFPIPQVGYGGICYSPRGYFWILFLICLIPV